MYRADVGRRGRPEALKSNDEGSAPDLYRDATSRWREYSNPLEPAHALAGQAHWLTALDRPADAALASDEAAAIFRELGDRGPALHLLPAE